MNNSTRLRLILKEIDSSFSAGQDNTGPTGGFVGRINQQNYVDDRAAKDSASYGLGIDKFVRGLAQQAQAAGYSLQEIADYIQAHREEIETDVSLEQQGNGNPNNTNTGYPVIDGSTRQTFGANTQI